MFTPILFQSHKKTARLLLPKDLENVIKSSRSTLESLVSPDYFPHAEERNLVLWRKAPAILACYGLWMATEWAVRNPTKQKTDIDFFYNMMNRHSLIVPDWMCHEDSLKKIIEASWNYIIGHDPYYQDYKPKEIEENVSILR